MMLIAVFIEHFVVVVILTFTINLIHHLIPHPTHFNPYLFPIIPP